MYDKNYYRTIFNEMKLRIKLSTYCDELNIQKSNLSRFLKGPAYDDVMSLQNLDNLYNSVINSLNNFVS